MWTFQTSFGSSGNVFSLFGAESNEDVFGHNPLSAAKCNESRKYSLHCEAAMRLL
jgi:hypothetical protein